MSKELSEMTNEELWALFPILLVPHDPAWAARYKQERERVVRAVGRENLARISHIGSTAVPGLVAKPTIDILLEIAEGCDIERLKTALIGEGYILSPQPQKPAPHLMGMKGYTPRGFEGQAVHLHVRCAGDWDELYFRDYLIAHPDAARSYGQLKVQLKMRYEHDRDAYTEAKSAFVREYTARARTQFGEKYRMDGRDKGLIE